MKKVALCLGAAVLTLTVHAQTLTAGSGTGSGGSTVPVLLTLSGAAGPAGLQFDVEWPKTITTVTAVIDASATASIAAGKNIYCNSPTLAGLLYDRTCLVVGLNANAIGNAPVVDMLVMLPSGFAGSATLTIAKTSGVYPNGTAMAVGSANGKVTKATSMSLDRSPVIHGEVGEMSDSQESSPGNFRCEPATVGRRAGEMTHCVLTIPEPASRKIVIGLSTSNDAMDIPKTVVIEAGQSEVQFDLGLKNGFNPPPQLFIAAIVGSTVVFTKLDIK